MESHLSLPDDKESFAESERSVDEDSQSRSNSSVRTAASQKPSPNVVKRESALTSTDNAENDRLLVVPVIGKAETVENDKCEADKAISIVDKETRNNLQVKFLSFPFV